MADGFRLNIKIDAAAQGIRVPKGVRNSSGRGIGGQFATGGDQSGLLAINREIANELQAAVVANIQAGIRRPAASTNRLVSVTAAEQNATATFDKIRVGNEAFLNDSVAKYWRTIEEGSAETWRRPFIGTQLYPIGRPPYPVAHGQRPGIRTFGGDEKPWMDGIRWVVKREIAPMHAYRDAVSQIQPGRRAAKAIVDYLEGIRSFPVLDV